MPIRHLTLGIVAVTTAIAPAGLLAGHATAGGDADVPTGDPAHAIYGDRIIDLSRGAQGAGACIELGTETRCYDTEAQLQRAHPQVSAAVSTTASTARACSGDTVLYPNSSYTGSPVVHLTTRLVVHDLASFGIDDTTSSYKILGCTSEFWEFAGAAGAAYPGNTSAGAQSATMAAGWNNRISSVYIY